MFFLSTITIILLLLGMFLFIMNNLLSKKKTRDSNKASPFECGFDPLNSSRLPFSIQFYVISIMFLIFDIEIIIFLPMIPSMHSNLYTNWSETGLIFVMILLFGLYVEWKDGALTWLK